MEKKYKITRIWEVKAKDTQEALDKTKNWKHKEVKIDEEKTIGRLYGKYAYYNLLHKALNKTFKQMIYIVPLVILIVFTFYFLMFMILIK